MVTSLAVFEIVLKSVIISHVEVISANTPSRVKEELAVANIGVSMWQVTNADLYLCWNTCFMATFYFVVLHNSCLFSVALVTFTLHGSSMTGFKSQQIHQTNPLLRF